MPAQAIIICISRSGSSPIRNITGTASTSILTRSCARRSEPRSPASHHELEIKRSNDEKTFSNHYDDQCSSHALGPDRVCHPNRDGGHLSSLTGGHTNCYADDHPGAGSQQRDP